MHSIFQPQLHMHLYPRYHCSKVVSGQFLVPSITYTLFVIFYFMGYGKTDGLYCKITTIFFFLQVFLKRKNEMVGFVMLFFGSYVQKQMLSFVQMVESDFKKSDFFPPKKTAKKTGCFLLFSAYSKHFASFY